MFALECFHCHYCCSMQPFSLFLNVHPPKLSSSCFFEHCCSYLWWDSQGLHYLPSFMLLQKDLSTFPTSHTFYCCASFKIHCFCFSSFLSCGSVPLSWSWSPAVHLGLQCMKLLIKSLWWGLYPFAASLGWEDWSLQDLKYFSLGLNSAWMWFAEKLFF